MDFKDANSDHLLQIHVLEARWRNFRIC